MNTKTLKAKDLQKGMVVVSLGKRFKIKSVTKSFIPKAIDIRFCDGELEVAHPSDTYEVLDNVK